MKNRIAPENITQLKPTEIFVFGSNLAGRHGKGAALLARRKFGAIPAQGHSIMGSCYGIPTKDERLAILPLVRIARFVDSFIGFAAAEPGKVFLVTKIGCGEALYTPEQIAPLFSNAVRLVNVWLPAEFWAVLEKGKL